MAITAGYDVGGAHLKVALAEGRPHHRRAADRLPAMARPRPARCGICRGGTAASPAPTRHAATMTGELCELFPDRRSGVAAILDRLEAILLAGHAHLDGSARIWRYRGSRMPIR